MHTATDILKLGMAFVVPEPDKTVDFRKDMPAFANSYVQTLSNVLYTHHKVGSRGALRSQASLKSEA
jgi:hypothetical protein